MHPVFRTLESLLSSRRRARVGAAAAAVATVVARRAIAGVVEPLESRRMFAVTASVAGGVLTVTGDDNPNAITVSRDVAGNLTVNNGAVAITGGTATVATITSIHAFGLGGNDAITIDDTNGSLP